jgi:hypothetical protein
MALWIRKPFGPIFALLCATALGCSSDDSSSIASSPIAVVTTNGGGEVGTTDAGSTIDGSNESSAEAGSTSTPVGLGAATSAVSGDDVKATCNSIFANALNTACTSDADCSLVDHNDCCGTIVIAIRKGTDAPFAAAEAAYQSCVPGCAPQSCFHRTEAQNFDVITRDGQAFFARCNGLRCTSIVDKANACLVSADCALGQICVTFEVGSTATSALACRSNPCASDMPTCSCAASVCAGFGAGICSESGGEIVCNSGQL